MNIIYKNQKKAGRIDQYHMFSDETFVGTTTQIAPISRKRAADGSISKRVPASFNFEPTSDTNLPAMSASTMLDLKEQILSAVEKKANGKKAA